MSLLHMAEISHFLFMNYEYSALINYENEPSYDQRTEHNREQRKENFGSFSIFCFLYIPVFPRR